MISHSAVGHMRSASAIARILAIVAAAAGLSCAEGADPVAPGSDKAGSYRHEPRLSLADSVLALNWNEIRIATGGPECTGQTDHPHKSNHVPGTVNVEAHTTCTGDVPFISVTARLYFRSDTTGTWTELEVGHKSSSAGQSEIKMNAAEPCQTGYYYGRGEHRVQYPGGTEVTELFPTQSPQVSITC
jgi:hypothetical protein